MSKEEVFNMTAIELNNCSITSYRNDDLWQWRLFIGYHFIIYCATYFDKTMNYVTQHDWVLHDNLWNHCCSSNGPRMPPAGPPACFLDALKFLFAYIFCDAILRLHSNHSFYWFLLMVKNHSRQFYQIHRYLKSY